MIMKNIYTVYFSPTGGTQKVAEALSNDLSQLLHIPSQKIDLTILANRQISYDFDSNALVILAVPVYAGRIPNKLLPDLERCLNGSGKTAIIPIGAAAMISQHAFSTHIAKSRPDSSDFEALTYFSRKIAEKILNNQEVTAITYDRDNPVGPYCAHFTDADFLSHVEMLENTYTDRKEAKFLL